MGVTNRHKLNNYIKNENYVKLKRLASKTPNKSMGEHLDAALELYYESRSEQIASIRMQISKEVKDVIDIYFDKIIEE